MSSFSKTNADKFKQLIYSNALKINDDGIKSNGSSETVYDQFYKQDEQTGEWSLRPEVDDTTATFLNNDPVFVEELRHFNVVAISGDNLNNFGGMVISPTTNPEEAMMVMKGTEPTSLMDWSNNISMGASNYWETPENSSQFNSAKVLLDKALDKQPSITEISTDGHSLGGALSLAVAAEVIKRDGLILGHNYMLNAPGFATASTAGMTAEQIAELRLKTTYDSVVGDSFVSEFFTDYIVEPNKIYSTGDGAIGKHSVTPVATLNGSSAYTDYINDDGSLNIEAFSQAVNDLALQENVLRDQINNMGISGDPTGVTQYTEQVSSYLYSLVSSSIDSIPFVSPDLDGTYIKLDKLQADREHLATILQGVDIGTTISNAIESTQNFIKESVGGQENLDLLQSIGDAVLNGLDSNVVQSSIDKLVKIGASLFASAESLDTVSREQFITSLQSSNLIDSLLNFDSGADVLANIADSLADQNRIAQQTRVFQGDPLTLDLDGDGIETISVDEGVLFDHEAKQVKEGTGWVSSDDGLLVRDLDRDGDIESGRELFGDNTIKSDGSKASDGFDALSDLDSNEDGVFDTKDEAFDEVQLWQDLNSDGISQSSELKSLSQVGLESINLSHQGVDQDTAGGVISDIGNYVKTDGSTAGIGNLFLDKEPARSQFTDEVAISEDILNTGVDIRGIGAVRNLSQAASLNLDLAAILTQMIENPAQPFQINNLLKEWAKSSDFSDTLNLESLVLEDGTSFKLDISDDTKSKLEQIQILETFTGNKIIQTNIDGGQLTMTYGTVSMNYNIVAGQENILADRIFSNGWRTINSTIALGTNQIQSGYKAIFDNVKESLFSQITYPEVIKNLEFDINTEAGDLEINFAAVNEYLSQVLKDDALSGLALIDKLKNFDSPFTNSWDYNQIFKNNTILTAQELETINTIKDKIDGKRLIIDAGGEDFHIGSNYADAIYGKDGDDKLYGQSGDDILVGGAGNDGLDAGFGDDILEGGAGNDKLHGGAGNDKLYGGSGDDIINTGGYDDNSFSEYVEAGLGDDTILTDYTEGQSTYKYNLGDGFDVIKRDGGGYSALNRNDVVLFGEGIKQQDINFSKQGSDLLITINGDTDQGIRLDSFYSLHWRNMSLINKFEFADGTIFELGELLLNGIDATSLLGMGKHIYEGDGNSTISGSGYSGYDIINAGAGDDNIFDLNGFNILNGGLGDDKLQGSGILIGGEGSDTLVAFDARKYTYHRNLLDGGKGNDYISLVEGSQSTIKYGLGDGFDVIRGNDQYGEKNFNNKIAFGDGISKEDLLFGKEVNDLIILVKEDTSQGLRVKDFFVKDQNLKSKVSKFEFADGSTLERGIDDQHFINDSIDSLIKRDVSYNLGDGFITIKESFETNIEFGEGISRSDVTFYRPKLSSDLVAIINNDQSQGLIVKDFYSSLYSSENKGDFKFVDGTVIEGESDFIRDLKQSPYVEGTNKNDMLTSELNTLTMEGAEGDDFIVINSESNNVTIKYNLGDGTDHIHTYGDISNHKILFGNDINPSDITLLEFYGSLKIHMNKEPHGDLYIGGFYRDESLISTIEFSNGAIISTADILELGADAINEMLPGLDIVKPKPTILGTEGSDTIFSKGNADDVIDAGSGNDRVNSRAGDDIIIGGQGDDIINAGLGNNTIIYNLGDGKDTLAGDKISNTEHIDKLYFGDGISKENIDYIRQGNHLFIQVNGDSSQGVLVRNYYRSSKYESKLSSILFVNGDSIDLSTIQPMTYGTDGEDRIRGKDGYDDVIKAGAGDDTINSGTGDDIIIGGVGNDVINGHSGNNTIIYNLGDGLDTIQADNISDTNHTDKIVFGEGILQEDVKYIRQGSDLFIQINQDTSQGIVVKKFYPSSAREVKVESIQFNNGETINLEAIQPITFGTDDSDVIRAKKGYTNYIDAKDGNDKLIGSDKADILIGGKGDDFLIGGGGADTYKYSVGAGNDTIRLANDGSVDTLRLEGVDSSNVEFEVQDKDLAILLRDDKQDLISKVMVDDYYTQTGETTDNFQIETDDATTDIPNFGEKLRQIKAEMMESIEKSAADIDGGAVNGNQVSTNMDSSEIMDIWIPKKTEGS